MRSQSNPTDGAQRGIIRVMYISVGFIAIAFAVGVCDLVFRLGPVGVWVGGTAVELPLAALGLLLGAVGCVALFYCARLLATRCTEGLVSDLAVRDAEGCAWYRRQRHAFGNHMQVVLGLLAFRRLDEAREYIKRVTESLRNDESAQFDRSCPELDSVLSRKVETAKKWGIDVVVLHWEACHRLEVSMLDACRIIGRTLDLAVECAAYCEQPSAVYVRNCTGHTLYTFLIEWRPIGLGGEDAAPDIAASEREALSDEEAWRGLRVAGIASLAEEVRLVGGALTFGRDSRQGFVEFSFPAIRAGD